MTSTGYEPGLLVLIDGGKGRYNAITKALQGHVLVQRCQWHKRENVVSYLAAEEQRRFRGKRRRPMISLPTMAPGTRWTS